MVFTADGQQVFTPTERDYCEYCGLCLAYFGQFRCHLNEYGTHRIRTATPLEQARAPKQTP